jgi:hypothetical protein
MWQKHKSTINQLRQQMMYQLQSYILIKEIDSVQMLPLSVQLMHWHDVMNCLHTPNPFWENNKSSVDNNNTHNTAKIFTTFPSIQRPRLPHRHRNTCSAKAHKIQNEGKHDSVQFTNILSYAHTGLLLFREIRPTHSWSTNDPLWAS